MAAMFVQYHFAMMVTTLPQSVMMGKSFMLILSWLIVSLSALIDAVC